MASLRLMHDPVGAAAHMRAQVACFQGQDVIASRPCICRYAIRGTPWMGLPEVNVARQPFADVRQATFGRPHDPVTVKPARRCLHSQFCRVNIYSSR